MRNDFYVGIYEDQYLAHTDTGAGRMISRLNNPRAHKYIKKVWRNGRWVYYYAKDKGGPIARKVGQIAFETTLGGDVNRLVKKGQQAQDLYENTQADRQIAARKRKARWKAKKYHQRKRKGG